MTTKVEQGFLAMIKIMVNALHNIDDGVADPQNAARLALNQVYREGQLELLTTGLHDWFVQRGEKPGSFKNTTIELTESEPGSLTFDKLTAVNLARCDRWHKGGIDDWSAEKWLGATSGELGEAWNALKKLWRIEDEISNISDDPSRQINTHTEAMEKVADELADTLLYLNLTACRLRINLAAATIRKFNATSVKYGFPERL